MSAKVLDNAVEQPRARRRTDKGGKANAFQIMKEQFLAAPAEIISYLVTYCMKNLGVSIRDNSFVGQSTFSSLSFYYLHKYLFMFLFIYLFTFVIFGAELIGNLHRCSDTERHQRSYFQRDCVRIANSFGVYGDYLW